MDIAKIAAISLIGAVLALYLRKYSADYALFISILAGILILAAGLTYVMPVLAILSSYAAKTSISSAQMTAVFKIIGTAYLAQFASDVCRDSDNSALAAKVEISAKFIIAYFSLPIVLTLFEYIAGLI